MHDAVLRYAREVAFATAEVYARAAEFRGAWDARLEALVVDAVLRAETDEAVAVPGERPGLGRPRRRRRGAGRRCRRTAPRLDVFESVRRSARAGDMDALCATQGDRLVVVLGGVDDPLKAATRLLDHFGDGPVVVGPVTADLAHANASARAALSAHRAASGWPDAPRPVASRDLLPERALAGDGHARRHLVDEVYLPADGRARHAAGDPRRLVRARLVDRGHGPGALRAPQHGALPAAPGRRASPAGPRPGRARPSPCSSR